MQENKSSQFRRASNCKNSWQRARNHSECWRGRKFKSRDARSEQKEDDNAEKLVTSSVLGTLERVTNAAIARK